MDFVWTRRLLLPGLVVTATLLVLNLVLGWALRPWPIRFDVPVLLIATSWLLTGCVGAVAIVRRKGTSKGWDVIDWWIIFGTLSVLWWSAAGGFNARRVCALAGTSMSALIVGGLLGFILTSYDEESDSVGKVREWLFAGLATATLVEISSGAHSVGRLLTILSPDGGQTDRHLHLAAVAIYFGCGFLTMFFTRETIWNPILAESRRRRRQIEQKVSQAISLGSLEPGRDDEDDEDFDDLPQDTKDAIAKLLATPLEKIAESIEAVKARAKAEYLQDKFDDATKTLKLGLAKFCNDLDLLFYMSHVLTADGKPLKAIPYLRRLIDQPRAPIVAWKYLGYCYLFDESEPSQAAAMTLKYLCPRPNDAGAQFNLACAYGQLGDVPNTVKWLKSSIAIRPGLRGHLRDLLDQDFKRVADEAEIKAILAEGVGTVPSTGDTEDSSGTKVAEAE